MAIPRFLAQTSAEFAAANLFPDRVGWMACHFSPYGTGLTNLPPSLPSGSLLILNDRIPMAGHDPEIIVGQLRQAVDALDCYGILLDFQRKGFDEARQLAAALTASLPCPVAVSQVYAEDTDWPVFLSPCPHHVSLEDHIAPWKGQRLWLDLAVNTEVIILTKSGSQILPLPLGAVPESGHAENLLHCHYSIETCADSVQFTLWRTKADLEALAQEAETLGVEILVGLYAEWGVQSGE